MKLTFPPTFDFVHQEFERTGVWEPRTTDYIKKHLKRGQVFLDVGAQVGYYSILAAQLGAKVEAFEPSSVNRTYLEQNIRDNNVADCIKVWPVALANANGRANLYNGRTPGENSLYGEGESEVVEVRRFDYLNLETPNFIKIDVEGFEKQVLAGMPGILNTTKPITLIIEDWYGKLASWLVDEHGFNLVTSDRAGGTRILTKNQRFSYEPEPLRIHLLGPFNTPTTLAPEGLGNAFASKVVRMAKILKKLNYYVIFYGVEGSNVECNEFVQCSTKELLEQVYGPREPDHIYPCGRDDLAHKTFNENCIREINVRKRWGDFLLCSHGSFHQAIAEAVQISETVEIGIGYTGSFAKFRIFESEFMRNWTYGAQNIGDGNFYDRVIPGFFEPSDFDYRKRKDDYFLYLGRVISRKGVLIARDACKQLGQKLVVAGFGPSEDEDPIDRAVFEEIKNDPNVDYRGFADLEVRRDLLSHAKGLFMPTTYLEPFGYVAIEAMLSGTPVITTNFGAFPETVVHGKTGYRCDTFADFVQAAKNIDKIKPVDCRDWALKRYSLDSVTPQYQNYFEQILELYNKGWYKL